MAATRGSGGNKVLAILVAEKPPAPPESTPKETDAPCDPLAPSEKEQPRTPMRLVTFDPRGSGAVREVRADLPGDAKDLKAADLDGDGRDAGLLLAVRDRLLYLRDDGQGAWAEGPTLLGEAPGLSRIDPGTLRTGASSLTWIASVGRLQGYGRSPQGSWGPVREIRLPVDVEKQKTSLRLSSPAVKIVSSPQAFLGTLPREGKGIDRVRTVVASVAPDGTVQESDCWCRLPARERVLESELLDLDGTRVLVLLTTPADTLSLLEKNSCGCPLEPDRRAPATLFAGVSRMNLWQEAHPVAADVNGDGRKDLVLGYWKGLKDDTLVLDAYIRRADGKLESSPRATTFDVEEADRDVLLFGEDLTRDGLPDLLIESNGALVLHAGVRSSSGSKIVDKVPRWTIRPGSPAEANPTVVKVQLGTGGTSVSVSPPRLEGKPRILQLDTEGAPAVVLVDGAARVAVVGE